MGKFKLSSIFILLFLGSTMMPFFADQRVVSANMLIGSMNYFFNQAMLSLLYVSACWLLLSRRSGNSSLLKWELILIFLIGIVFRSLYWPYPPTMSGDAFHYVWDPLLLSHGISPYLHTPSDPSLQAFRDPYIWPHLNWPNAPGIYPPAAQVVFLVTYLISPLNIFAIKVMIALSDILIALLLLILLKAKNLDPRRVMIYWWCPLPIFEFALDAHMDALVVLWVVISLVCLQLARERNASRWSVWGGISVGMGVLTKLYPLLYIPIFLYSLKNKWQFLVGLSIAMIVIVTPFLFIGLGNGGFLGNYTMNRLDNQGIALKIITIIAWHLGAADSQQIIIAYVVLASVLLAFYIKTWRNNSQLEVSLLLANLFWIAFAPHLFAWYVIILLPLLALFLHLPGIAQKDAAVLRPWVPQAIWQFVLFMPFMNVFLTPGYNSGLFLCISLIPCAFAGLSWGIELWQHRRKQNLYPISF